MHALVTGGGGFLGGYIIEALVARGDRVRSFGRGDYPQLREQGVEVIRGDIRDRNAVAAACKGIDCVFHTAAITGLSSTARAHTEFVTTNTWGTRQVILGCRAHRVPRLVFTSSPSAVFSGQDQAGVDESVRYNFDWLFQHGASYSVTKATAEFSVLRSNGRGFLRTCALRPHLIWGPGDTHLIPRLIARAKSGRLRRIGDGTNLVDITYVENAAEAHLLAADALARTDSPVGGKTYFISQGEPVNCWQWIDEVLALADLPAVKRSMSFKTAWRIGAACEAAYRLLRINREPPMTRFLAAQLATSHWFDISAARRDLGYRPRVPTAEGMQRLGKWLSQTS
ncbi:MAG TPA: NAD-dependent epimerase/dehydratase family protein [Lacipirellulaceae bacterium]|jgi:nucleoside-diphosphate-sugar epimerase|nr:NAD-dependent epimerase/dehydratase family protein [Lacipirellulaceae bacterium]